MVLMGHARNPVAVRCVSLGFWDHDKMATDMALGICFCRVLRGGGLLRREVPL